MSKINIILFIIVACNLTLLIISYKDVKKWWHGVIYAGAWVYLLIIMAAAILIK